MSSPAIKSITVTYYPTTAQPDGERLVAALEEGQTLLASFEAQRAEVTS